MNFKLAIQAFIKAFKEPKKAKIFLDDEKLQEKIGCDKPQEDQTSHLRLLSFLQESGRLIDFLKEDITQFSDAQVGSAVRKIHGDCAKGLEDLVTIRPILEEKEGSIINIPQGYDPITIKVVGKIKGEPPFKGILVHAGWKAHKRSLPKKIAGLSQEVLSPAEVEVS